MILKNTGKMKQAASLFILLFINFLFFVNQLMAQTKPNDYKTQWKKIDDLIEKGLTKSAITEVKKIYTLAKKDNNDAQLIKSLMFQSMLNEQVDENAGISSIKEMEKEAAAAKQDRKSVV